MMDLLELEYRISERRAEVEEDIRQEARTRQLQSGRRVANEFEPRVGLRARLRLVLANEGTRR